MDKKFIIDRIAELRIKLDKSERKMSEELGHVSTYLSRMGKNKGMPKLETLLDICDYFEITLSDFFKEEFEYKKSRELLYSKLDSILNELEDEEVDKFIKIMSLLDKQKVKALVETFEGYEK